MKNTKKFLIMMIAALFLVTMPAIKADAAARKVVFIGDSYSRTTLRDGKSVTGWPYIVAQYMGLKTTDYQVSANPGYGFSTSAPYGNKFISLMNSYKTDLYVTDVILAAGMNDWRYSDKRIAADIATYTTEIRKKYPNARLYMAYIGWTVSSVKLQNILKAKAPVYKAAAAANGWTWLEGPQRILYGRLNVFASDKLHPNILGEKLISASIYKAYTNVAPKTPTVIRVYNTMKSSISVSTVRRASLGKASVQARLTVSNAAGAVHFKSSNEKYAPISSNGVITFKKGCPAGTYYFRVVADGNAKYLPKKVVYTVVVK